jgi:hypothetical protein
LRQRKAREFFDVHRGEFYPRAGARATTLLGARHSRRFTVQLGKNISHFQTLFAIHDEAA